MRMKVPAYTIKLRVARREKEVEVNNLENTLSIRLKKSRDKENQRPDVTYGNIEYFMLKPEAKAVHYLQPGEIVGVKFDDKWVRFNLLKLKRLSYKHSSLLWKMMKHHGEVVTKYLTPADQWGVLCGIDYLLDLGEMEMKVPHSKQQDYMLSTNCNICNDGTMKLFAEEVQHLVKKLQIRCLHAGLAPGPEGLARPQEAYDTGHDQTRPGRLACSPPLAECRCQQARKIARHKDPGMMERKQAPQQQPVLLHGRQEHQVEGKDRERKAGDAEPPTAEDPLGHHRASLQLQNSQHPLVPKH